MIMGDDNADIEKFILQDLSLGHRRRRCYLWLLPIAMILVSLTTTFMILAGALSVAIINAAGLLILFDSLWHDTIIKGRYYKIIAEFDKAHCDEQNSFPGIALDSSCRKLLGRLFKVPNDAIVASAAWIGFISIVIICFGLSIITQTLYPMLLIIWFMVFVYLFKRNVAFKESMRKIIESRYEECIHYFRENGLID